MGAHCVSRTMLINPGKSAKATVTGKTRNTTGTIRVVPRRPPRLLALPMPYRVGDPRPLARFGDLRMLGCEPPPGLGHQSPDDGADLWCEGGGVVPALDPRGPVLMGADDARSVVESWPDGSVAVAEVGDYPLQRVERGPGRDRPGRRAPIGAGGTTRRQPQIAGVSRDGRQVYLTNSPYGGSTLSTSTAHTAHRSWVTTRSGSTPASSRYRSSPAANPGPDLGADLLPAQPGGQRRGQLIGGSGSWSPGRAESRRW